VGDSIPVAEYVVGSFEDSKGVPWFGTMSHGVARYAPAPLAGVRTLTYIDTALGLPPEGGHSIAEDANGLLWFAGHDGVYTYDPAVPDARVKQVFATAGRVGKDRGGHVWVSTDRKLYQFKDGAQQELKSPVPPRATGEAPPPYTIGPGHIFFQLEDRQGRYWFSTDGYGAYRYDPMAPADQAWTRLTKADGLCSNTPWAIAEDREGRIWFACVQAFQPTATGDGGLCALDPSTPLRVGTFRSFPDVPGLHHNDLYTLLVDRDGALWSSAFKHGVYRYLNGSFTLFNTTDRPDLNGNFGLQAMMQDSRGRYWMGFSGGLFTLQGDRLVHVPRGGPWE
jgi:ligand-binding sensor domain-containing protein